MLRFPRSFNTLFLQLHDLSHFSHHHRPTPEMDNPSEAQPVVIDLEHESLESTAMPGFSDKSLNEAQNLLSRGKYVRNDDEPIDAGYKFPTAPKHLHALKRSNPIPQDKPLPGKKSLVISHLSSYKLTSH